MKKNVIKGLAIISVIIIVLGIVCGMGVANDILNLVSSNNNIYIDGSDFTGISQLLATFGATILGVLIALCGFAIVAAIWTAYIVVVLMIKLFRYIKRRNAEKSAVLPNEVPSEQKISDKLK